MDELRYTRRILKNVNMENAKQLEMELDSQKKKSNVKNARQVMPEKLEQNKTNNDNKIAEEEELGKDRSKQTETEGKYFGFLIIIAIVVILLAVGVFIYQQPPNDTKEILYSSPTDIFLKTMENLKDQFPEIPLTSIFMINYTIWSMLDHNDPRSPASVLLLGTNGKTHYTDKVLLQLMTGLSETFEKEIDIEKQVLDFDSVDKSNIHSLKLDINLKIDRLFENKKYRFIALKNVDKAPWDVVSVLHPYFDHENAPYKRVVYLCTATTNDYMKEEDLKEYRRLAENLFDIAWEKYHSDYRNAMYGRLFTSIAVL